MPEPTGPHIIRLHAVWTVVSRSAATESTPARTIILRRFNSPTGLEPGDSVALAFGELVDEMVVWINEVQLGVVRPGTWRRFPVRPLLKSQNELRVEFNAELQTMTGESTGLVELPGRVQLEIGNS